MSKPCDIWFVYDGECPICTMGASFYKVRQAVGELHLLDARQEKQHPVIYAINKAGLDLDVGMIIKYQERLYQGNEALHLMAELGSDEGLFNQINRTLFRSKRCADILYPCLRAVRNLALKIKGVRKINNLRNSKDIF